MSINMVTQTRFKLTVMALALGCVEGLIRVLLKDFPIIEVLGFQGAALGTYLAARTVSGVKSLAMGNGSEETEESEGHEIPSDRPAVTMVMEKPEKP
jgi:hypothetical protein